MPLDAAKKKLLYKIAMAYYEDDLTQEQIARRFGLSRVKVSRLLQQARHERVVQITIVPPLDPKPDLERRLEVAYGLDEAIVATRGSEGDSLLRELGAAAADYLMRCLQGNEVVAMSWGSTLSAVVDALQAENWPDLRVVQINGGVGNPEAKTHGADLTRRLAEAFNAHAVVLSAPGIVSSKMVRDALLADPQVSEPLALSARADVALVGIGAPTAEALVTRLGTILPQRDIDGVRARGAVGDIALRFFDARGRPVEHEINERIIGLDLAQIGCIPRVIGVAGGVEKHGVIRAAARGRLVDVLVTDEATALALLEDNP